jgi:glutathione S-transferase
MPITLYELAGADPERRFSPFCWRIRFALAHKGLDFEGIPWRFTETERLEFSGQGKVPVIVDGESVVVDSWAIASYLEDAYPNHPSLFGGKVARAHARFLNAWADRVLHAGIARLVVRDILDVIHPEHRDYFRTSRERAFGRSLEDVVADRDEGVLAFRKTLQPVRDVLGHQPWLGGDEPDYTDYIVLGSLQWPRCVSPFVLLEETDPVRDWQLRGLALFDGLGANAPALAA